MTIIPIKKCIPWLRWDENIALEIVFSAALAEDRTIVKETQVAFKKITTPLLTTPQYKVEISSYTGNGSETTLMAGCTHNQSPSDYSMTDSKNRWSHYMHICLINRPIAEITFWLCKKIIICWFLGNETHEFVIESLFPHHWIVSCHCVKWTILTFQESRGAVWLQVEAADAEGMSIKDLFLIQWATSTEMKIHMCQMLISSEHAPWSDSCVLHDRIIQNCCD